ncbi:MAG TPA: hypothetical protein VGH63_06615 [Polyangia bacterium]
MHVVAGADVAVDGEAQRAAGVGRRVEGGGARVAAVGRAVEADAIVVDGAGVEVAQMDDVVCAESVAGGGGAVFVAAPANVGGGGRSVSKTSVTSRSRRPTRYGPRTKRAPSSPRNESSTVASWPAVRGWTSTARRLSPRRRSRAATVNDSYSGPWTSVARASTGAAGSRRRRAISTPFR